MKITEIDWRTTLRIHTTKGPIDVTIDPKADRIRLTNSNGGVLNVLPIAPNVIEVTSDNT